MYKFCLGLCIYSLSTFGIFAQAQEVLNLSKTHTYIQELVLKDGSTLPITAAKLDWEMVIHEAAAMLNLKKIKLPNKEILSSYAMTLRVLQRQPESTFYNRPTTYSKFLTPFLSQEENNYLQEQLLFFDSLYKAGNGIKMGDLYLNQAHKERNYALIADSLIARAYALPYPDPSDYEAILRSKWSKVAAKENKFEIAIEQQKQVYQIRKERKDWLSYSSVPLARLYEETEQWDNLLDLYRDVLSEMASNDYGGRQNNSYSIWTMIAYIAEYGNVDEAIEYFKAWAPHITESRQPVWSTPNWVPYHFAIKELDDISEVLAYAQSWAEQLRKHGGPNLNQSDIIPLLEALKPHTFKSKAISEFMQSVFEEFYFPSTRNLNWKRSNSKYWFWGDPYLRVILHQKPEEQFPTLERWMGMALRTENYEIIRETSFHVAYHVAKIDKMELADSIFVQYYCTNLLNRSDNEQAWLQASPYAFASGDKATFWYEHWINLSKKHASIELQIDILRFVARQYYDKNQYAASVPFHEEVLRLRRQERDLKGEERSLNHLLWLHRDVLEAPLATTHYTIQLYKAQLAYYHLVDYPIYLTYLESAFALLKAQERISKKEKRKIVGLWKDWATTLDESDVRQLSIKINVGRLLRFLGW